MKKTLIVLSILSFIVLLSCNEETLIVENDYSELSKKPAPPDPEPVATFPYLDASSKYISGIVDKIYLWETSGYSIIWSYDLDASLPKVGLVDVEGDGSKELVLFEWISEGKGRKATSKYYFSVFHVGSNI